MTKALRTVSALKIPVPDPVGDSRPSVQACSNRAAIDVAFKVLIELDAVA
jgi:hypothetical protein